MIYVYVGILGIFVTLFVLSWREEEKRIFRKMAAYVLGRQQDIRQKHAGGRNDWKRDLCRRQLGDKLKTLQPGLAVPGQIKAYYLTQYSRILMVVFLGDLFCLAVWISAHSNPMLMEGSYLWRNPHGEGRIPVELAAQIEGAQEEIFDYLVEERKYTQDEIQVLYEEAVKLFPEIILGENEIL